MPKTLTSFDDAQNAKIESALRVAAQAGEKGNLLEAQNICDRILSDFPDHPGALYYSALVSLQANEQTKALRLMERVKEIEPKQSADFYQNLGIVYAGLNLFDKSIENLQFSLKLNSRSSQVHFNLALAYSKKGDQKLAIHHYEKVIALTPNYFTAHNSLGNIFQEQGKIEKALQYYKQAISINPRYAESFANRAGLYKKIKSYSLAQQDYQKALSLKPDFIEARNNYGVLLVEMESYRAALEQFTLILKQNPHYLHTLKNAGDLSHRIEHYADASNFYRTGLKLEPENLSFINSLMQTFKAQAQWDEESFQLEKKQLLLINNSLQKKEKIELSPFSSLSMNFNDEEQLTIAENHAQHTFQAIMNLPAEFQQSVAKETPHRLRVGYLSADFRDHPVCHLLSGILEMHNLRQFDVIAYYIGPPIQTDKYQERVIRSVNQFVRLNNLTDQAAAQRIAKDSVHILIDLMGYTQYARPEILAYRPAPVQIGFFGYPGTSGASFMDYYIVDKIVVPLSQSRFFSERLIYLPDSYLPTDNRMGISSEVPSRAYYGLPEKDFVFCCFCNHYKLNADVFNAWMQILKAVPNSVLWLFASNEFFENNLKAYAEKAGIEKKRLLFAKKEPKEKHIARYQLANLFLDTFVYNAHATAIDALWAGLPLITYPGNSMATRVSASLLTTLRLPQFIAQSLENYIQLAVTLAQDPQQLHAIHQHLKWARTCLPLFNTTHYTQYLESAYQLAFYQKAVNKKNPIIIPEQKFSLTPECEKSQPLEKTKTHSHRRYQSSNNGGVTEREFEWTQTPYSLTTSLYQFDEFYSGKWDAQPYLHAETGAPVFVYRVFKQGYETGSAHFYQHPVLCKRESGDRHNVEFFGVLSTRSFTINPSQISDICASLPDTPFEETEKTIQRAAEHGIVRGTSNVVEYAMKKSDFSKTTASLASEAIYFSGFFAMRFYQQTNLAPDLLTAASQAAVETGLLFGAQKTMQAVRCAGNKIKKQGWNTAGESLISLSHYLNYLRYGYEAYTQGIAPVAASIIAGAAAQTTVEIIGKASVDHFLNSHQTTLQKQTISAKAEQTILTREDNASFEKEIGCDSITHNSINLCSY
jgi:predicted O-linked N-acetylglucosamine transferase (SPINDLY family)